MNDAQNMVHRALTEVLKEYGLEWDDTRTKRSNAVEFRINGIKYRHTYSSGGGRTHFNARSDLRRRLNSLGLSPLGPPLEAATVEEPIPVDDTTQNEAMNSPELEAAEIEDVQFSETAEAEHIEPEHIQPETVEPAMPDQPNPNPPRDEDEPQRAEERRAAAPESLAHKMKPAVRGHVYQSPRVLAIEVDRELIVEKGNMLVIPLNKPNTVLDMTKEQFYAIFEEVADEAPQPPPRQPRPARKPELMRTTAPPPTTPRPQSRPRLIMPPQAEDEVEEDFDEDQDGSQYAEGEEGDYEDDDEGGEEGTYGGEDDDDDDEVTGADELLAYLKQRRGAVKSKVIAHALGWTIKYTDHTLRLLQNQGIVESGPPGFWAIANVTGRPQRFTRRMEQEAEGVEQQPTARRRNGPIPAQLGRIMAVMAYVTSRSGKLDVSAGLATPHLDARDAKQFGARMPGAIQMGYVERSKEQFHYRLTPKGFEILRTAGTYPYDADALQPPSWLETVLAQGSH